MKNEVLKTKMIALDRIHPFEGHPYQVREDEGMAALVDSIRDYGVLTPVLLRPSEKQPEKFETISGHRRINAAAKVGMQSVPAFVVSLNRDDAAILLVDSNLHREQLLPSEKAFAYKLKSEALKHQGKTLCQVGTKLRSDEIVALESGESARQVQRYIRLTYLLPGLLQMVDDGKIALTPAEALSYLQEAEQKILLDAIDAEQHTPSLSQAIRMKNLSKAGELNEETLVDILSQEKPNQRENLRIPMERIGRYFPAGYTNAQIENEIIKLLEARRKQKQRTAGRER